MELKKFFEMNPIKTFKSANVHLYPIEEKEFYEYECNECGNIKRLNDEDRCESCQAYYDDCEICGEYGKLDDFKCLECNMNEKIVYYSCLHRDAFEHFWEVDTEFINPHVEKIICMECREISYIDPKLPESQWEYGLPTKPYYPIVI